MTIQFENLTVYRDSLTFVRDIQILLADFGRQCPTAIRNQLPIAALSIPLNIAEGNGRWHKAEKRQFYYISRGSAYECVSILQEMRGIGLLDDERMKKLYENLVAITKMLSALIRSVEDLKRTSPSRDA